MTPSAGSWPWLILHWKHEAWYQRALMRGDFAPNRKPLPNYVCALDGTKPDPSETPCCGTCGKVPRTQDLTPVERATGQRDFLIELRRGLESWALVGRTLSETCYACNGEGPLAVDGYVKLCKGCEPHLRKGGE